MTVETTDFQKIRRELIQANLNSAIWYRDHYIKRAKQSRKPQRIQSHLRVVAHYENMIANYTAALLRDES